MNKLEKYLFNHRDDLVKQKNSIYNSIDKLVNENLQVEIKITELTKNLDTTFEVFSPNSMINDYNVTEIDKLKSIYRENEVKKQSMEKKKEKVDDEIFKINDAISLYEDMKKEILTLNDDRSDIINNKKINQRELEKLTVGISELEIKRMERKISKEIIQILDSLTYKEKLCEKFIEMDINRSKLELIEIKEGLHTLHNKANNFMFHVKHSNIDNNFSLLQNIKNHIKKYNISSEIITVTSIGDDVIMPSYDIENNLRIIDEILENSISHGRAKNINIHISIISSLDKDEIIALAENMKQISENNKIDSVSDSIDEESKIEKNKIDTNNEKIINYDLKDISNNFKHINIAISDDGYGFDTGNLNKDRISGLTIVRKRLELYFGELNIKSSNEFGTTVNYNYNYIQ